MLESPQTLRESLEIESLGPLRSPGSARQIPVRPPRGSFDEVSMTSARQSQSPAQVDSTIEAREIVPTPHQQIRQLAAQYANVDRNPKVHEVFTQLGGHVRFRCGGRCVTGPPSDFKLNACAWTSILLPTLFYFWKCAPSLWVHHFFHPVLTAALFCLTIVLMLITSFTDPGIVPRHAMRLLVKDLAEDVAIGIGLDPKQIDITSHECPEELLDELETQGYRWCQYCHMIQPPRAKHCRDCDCCVLRCDHHCPLVNNCIGQRNYAYFCGFLVAVCSLSLAVFTGAYIWWTGRSDGDHSGRMLMYMLGIPTVLLFLAVFGLTCFHSVLICRGKTTREALTGKVFGEGSTLFGFRGPSLLHAQDEVRFPRSV